MVFGIILIIISILGFIYGIKTKQKSLTIFSIIMFLLVIIKWMYFYFNPY